MENMESIDLENIEVIDPYSEKELRELEEELKRASEMPITFDEDCPEVTPEQAIHYYRVNPHPNSLNPTPRKRHARK